MNIFIRNMEANESVKRYQIIECKLGENDKQRVEDVNKFFEQFKKEYKKADSKKEFYKVNNLKDNDSTIYNLKLIFDLFNWQEITIESINKVSKLHKKKAENILKTLCRRIEEYKSIKG